MSIRIAILVSGRGTNLEAILAAVKRGELDAHVEVVISNNPEALALHVARKYGVHALAIDNRGMSRAEHERLVLEELSSYRLDYVVLAGYMRILSSQFLRSFKDDRGFYRVINIHPSLLPRFPGINAYEEAFNAGVDESGITIHLVDEQVDHGPILAQRTFPRLPDDTLETFRARGLALEHELYPAVLKEIALHGIRLSERTTTLNPGGGAGNECLCLAVVPRGRLAKKGRYVELPLYWLKTGRSASELAVDNKLIAMLEEVLADPLLEELWAAEPEQRERWAQAFAASGFRWLAERQFLPGVTDNLARTVEEALQMSGFGAETSVASGTAYLFPETGTLTLKTSEAVERYSRYRFFHPLTDRFAVHDLAGCYNASEFLRFPAVKLPAPPPVKTIPLDLPDEELAALSRERVLALSIEELRAVRAYFKEERGGALRKEKGLPQRPTDVELEIIAQTWSEHCKHKIFNAVIEHTDMTKPDALKHTTIDSLYKTYIQAATGKLKERRNDLLSVFEDNAGVVRWNDEWGICFKVETHNSPSALEPYGGALTGILGVNRDILGTGLGAKPILNTDVFCFAHPSPDLPSRPTMLPAETIIQGVRKGVQDGGNKMGIPTVNGAVYFHPGYRAKPLVFCGTAGILPLSVDGRKGYLKDTRAGDTIVMVGGRVGKDGIHGATFSSEALHEGSPISAVQIGDPFTQKRMLDFIIEARDAGLVSGITDNGAGGLSSSVGEMAQLTGGATLELENIPLKYPGLADWEIVVSESQERMTLSTRRFAELKRLAEKHRVEVTAVGRFHDSGYFEVTRNGKTVALLDLHFLHKGVPKMRLESRWAPPAISDTVAGAPADNGVILLKLLSHPNICSREVVIRQYDHEVQGGSVVKALMGPSQLAPCDCAVIKPLFTDDTGLAVANGLCPQLSEFDPYLMAACAVDEAVRNAVCVGADPDALYLLDNFCWPDPVPSKRNEDAARKLAQLVRACQGLFDAALAYGAPLISGKDSMKNDFDDGTLRLSIPPTLLVSAIARVPHVARAVTMEFKSPGDLIYLASAGEIGLAGSVYAQLLDWSSSLLPSLDLDRAARMYRCLHSAMNKGLIKSCHDLSEGGLAVALAECVIGSGLGAEIGLASVIEASVDRSQTAREPGANLRRRPDVAMFGEGAARLVVTVAHDKADEFETLCKNITVKRIGTVTDTGALRFTHDGHTALALPAAELTAAWQALLPFEEGIWKP